MAALVVIVDMRLNNPAAGCRVLVDDREVPTLFLDMAEIRMLRMTHITGALPWIVVDLDTGRAEFV